MAVLDNIEPKKVFKYFEEICGIPHGSSDTKRISDYLVNFANTRNLKVIQDNMNNVIIFKPGTAGYENSAPVMIQGHMDMVCEKDKDCDIDFSKDGLRLRVDGNVISADGTTLGGDDGIALAFALAILDSDENEIPHPPLEVIFTVDEEIGMFGATGLDCYVLSSKIMLNLDSEDEGKLLVSCAGGVTSTCYVPVEYSDFRADDTYYAKKITVTGISGGHSGVEIDKQGANANKVLGRVLYSLKQDMDFCLIELNGGLKENAIPRESYAVITYKDSNETDILNNKLQNLGAVLKNEYGKTDADIQIVISDTEESYDNHMSKASTDKVIAALVSLPNGIQRMSSDIEGLVQTSLSLGIMKTAGDEVSFCYSVRSSVESEKEELEARLKCLMEALGGRYTAGGSYPAWEYRRDSKLRDLMVDVYKDMFKEEPEIQAIHAGVECGIFAGKVSDLDCVSYGPQMDDIHTSSERLYIDSVVRTWNYTLEILKRLK